MMNKLVDWEEKTKSLVRKSEDEVKSILNDRIHEETVTELTFSIYDTERNLKARQYQNDIVKKYFLKLDKFLLNYLFINSF